MADRYAVADLLAALAERRYPTVTSWNRVEGRPRTVNFERALRAEVRDALWMLAKQWQIGEFRAEDAGSPVFARLCLGTTRLTRFRPGDAAAEDVDDRLPLEAQIERQPLAFAIGADKIALDLRLVMGRRWLTLIRPIGDYASLFVARYKIDLPNPSRREEAGVCAHPEVWQSVAAAAERVVDGVALYQYLTGGAGRHAYDGVMILDAHKPAIDEAGRKFVAWVERLFEQPGRGLNAAWKPERLEYQFGCSAPGLSGAKVYTADEYYQGTLDWYSLDADGRPASESALGAAASADPRSSVTRTMIPVPVTYPGMPHARWWTFEDAQTNFGEIRADTTDLAKLLFIEFGLVYSNDWFIIPVTLAAGSIASPRGLAVTNVFGERFLIGPVGQGAASTWQRWSLFTPDVRGGAGAVPDGSLILLPTAPKVQEGPPLEEILMIRDEMANMVWGIERTIPGSDGRGRSGAAAGRETRAYHERLVAAAATPSPPQLVNDAKIRYDVMSTVPEHWIPFIGVRARGSQRAIDLQRASLPRVIEGDPVRPYANVKPRTTLLRVGLDGASAPMPYLVAEEEVPRAGIRVTESFQRARWVDGRAVVWLGVRKETGRGEGSSGLAFDRILSVD